MMRARGRRALQYNDARGRRIVDVQGPYYSGKCDIIFVPVTLYRNVITMRVTEILSGAQE